MAEEVVIMKMRRKEKMSRLMGSEETEKKLRIYEEEHKQGWMKGR